MKAEQRIREEMKRIELHPLGEINACQIYKTWEGWQIAKFGEQPWNAGANLREVLEALKEIADSREER
jgi:hypothetical protein